MACEKVTKRCEARVFTRTYPPSRPCERMGVTMDGGGWYCRQHMPSNVRQRSVAREAERLIRAELAKHPRRKEQSP